MPEILAVEVPVHQKVKWNLEDQLIPLTIGLIGHRKLAEQEINGIVAEFDDFLARLLGPLKHTPILLLTSLAEGADRIALRSKFRDSLTICAVLPFKLESYRKDFQGPRALLDFEESLKTVDLIIEPFTSDAKSTERNLAYRKCANWISERSNILVAIWNGKFNEEPGGTSDTIAYRTTKNERIGFSESLNTDVFHIIGSNGNEGVKKDCDCIFHKSSQKAAFPDLKLIESFNEAISIEILKKDSRDISLNIFDSMASAAKKKYLRASRIILILGLVALNLLNITQISNSRICFFATLSTFSLTFIVWHRSLRLNLKAKYESFRMIAEVLRIQSWWTQIGIEIRLIDHHRTNIESDNEIRKVADNLIATREIQSLLGFQGEKRSLEVDEIHQTAKLWLTEQMEYLGGDSNKIGAIRANGNSARRFDLLSKVFVGVTLILFILTQQLELEASDFSANIFFMFYTMLIPICLSISAGSIAYIQLMGFKEIAARFESSFRVIQRSLLQLKVLKKNTDKKNILSIVEEVGVESYCESIYWYKISKSRDLRPL